VAVPPAFSNRCCSVHGTESYPSFSREYVTPGVKSKYSEIKSTAFAFEPAGSGASPGSSGAASSDSRSARRGDPLVSAAPCTSPVRGCALKTRIWRSSFRGIHTFSASYLSFLLAPAPAILIGRLFKKKVILNYRSGECEDHLRTWPRTSVPIMRLADELIVPSQYLIDVFWKFGLRATAVANIFDPDRFRYKERKPLQPIFLSNRNLYPLYNVACILRAFAKIQQTYPEARLIIAGDGSQRPLLEALARELKLEHVEFRGRVAPHKMHELYDEAHIFLNSSNIDNMPGSILESFASGLPVITTDAGGIPYIVTHEKTGLLVPRGDHEALADAAIRLLKDPALAAAITDRAYAETGKYSWSAVRNDWLHLYERLGNGLQFSSRPVPHEEPL